MKVKVEHDETLVIEVGTRTWEFEASSDDSAVLSVRTNGEHKRYRNARVKVDPGGLTDETTWGRVSVVEDE